MQPYQQSTPLSRFSPVAPQTSGFQTNNVPPPANQQTTYMDDGAPIFCWKCKKWGHFTRDHVDGQAVKPRSTTMRGSTRASGTAQRRPPIRGSRPSASVAQATNQVTPISSSSSSHSIHNQVTTPDYDNSFDLQHIEADTEAQQYMDEEEYHDAEEDFLRDL